MTILREDGYLVTDAPPVVACFIECKVVEPRSKRTVTIDLVGRELVNEWAEYPIEIPASAVKSAIERSGLAFHIMTAFVETEGELIEWVRRHVAQEEQ